MPVRSEFAVSIATGILSGTTIFPVAIKRAGSLYVPLGKSLAVEYILAFKPRRKCEEKSSKTWNTKNGEMGSVTN